MLLWRVGVLINQTERKFNLLAKFYSTYSTSNSSLK